MIYWILFGVLAGIVAYLIDDNPKKGGVVGPVLNGIIGALIGGNLANLIFSEFSFAGIMSLGAVFLGSVTLLLVRKFLYSI
jgi:uncharacterized membrane protein YeaQ/YmgE (transglycosylase-associated protein family)